MLRRWFLASIAAVFAAVSLGLPSDADASRFVKGRAAGGGGGAQPYTYYPSFDKTLFPPQTAGGVWGPQSTIKEASAPQGAMTDVTANSSAQVASHICTANRRITLTASFTGGGFNSCDITDVEIVIPAGIVWQDPIFGNPGTPSGNQITRLRIRGSTLGDLSTAGQLHHAAFYKADDLIIDAMHLSGPAGNAGCIVTGFTSNRLAITRSQANCGGYFFIGTNTDATFTCLSVQTGMDTATPAEGWGIRMSHEALGNVVGYALDIRSNPARVNNSHHRIRVHPDPGLDYVWIFNSTFVDRVESRIFMVNAAFGTGSGTARATWFDTNTVIAASCCGVPPGIEGQDQDYAFIQNITFQSDTFLSNSNIVMTGNTSTTKTGNTYAGVPGSDPAWSSCAGDPTGIDWTP